MEWTQTREWYPMKMQEVKAKAKAMKINSFGKTKVELIREIQRMEGNFDCYGRAEGSCDQMECCFRESCLDPRK
jgi:hypothetical protein